MTVENFAPPVNVLRTIMHVMLTEPGAGTSTVPVRVQYRVPGMDYLATGPGTVRVLNLAPVSPAAAPPRLKFLPLAPLRCLHRSKDFKPFNQ